MTGEIVRLDLVDDRGAAVSLRLRSIRRKLNDGRIGCGP
jgi:hypothetical protein